MEKSKYLSYNFWAIIILIFYAISQVSRWTRFPQHIDIYYHLLTAWGFIKAGGYTNWDFWQYAPVGRPHIYPPLFHTILAIPMKAGIDKIFLARLFDVVTPPAFLFVLWNFIRKNFSPRLAFLVLIAIGSSFSFYASLANHIPSTMAMIFGFLALEQFLNKKNLQAALLLALCFYTHIGTSWFIALSLLAYSLFTPLEKGSLAGFIRETRKPGIYTLISALFLSLPILVQQLVGLKSISFSAVNKICSYEFKTVDYILAAIGFVLALRIGKKYFIFIAFFIASFVYAAYPERLFSSEGYLPIALLSAVFLDALCDNVKRKKYLKYAVIIFIVFILIFSPTFAIGDAEIGKSFYRIYLFDSAIMNMLFLADNERMISKTIWFKDYYPFVVKLIRENSGPDDIIYCTEESIGLCLAALSERATADYLLPEVRSPRFINSDPFRDSKIIVMLKYHPRDWVEEIVKKYGLVLIGKNRIFDVYKNPQATAKIRIRVT